MASTPIIEQARKRPVRLLQDLPEELLQDVLSLLSRADLYCLNSSSRWCYQIATPWLWREVTLQDRRFQYPDDLDEHDDTPIIKKLIVLSGNPWIASHVQILNHQCHLPPPSIFNELPRCTFASHTLSSDPRTSHLAVLATQNLTRLHTLRIVFGHPHLNDALLRGLFSKTRTRENPIRRLWLDNCRISAGCDLRIDSHPYGLPLELDFAGLETIRFRRMPIRPGSPLQGSSAFHEYHYTRGTDEDWNLQDGMGGQYFTTVTIGPHRLDEIAKSLGFPVGHADDAVSRTPSEPTPFATSPLAQLFDQANKWDDISYETISAQCGPSEQAMMNAAHTASHEKRSGLAFRGCYLDPPTLENSQALPLTTSQRERTSSAVVMLNMLQSTSLTLTSLNLDWIISQPPCLRHRRDAASQQTWVEMVYGIFSLRFPHLRAFQVRNGVMLDTVLPHGLYLLDHSRPKTRDNRPGVPSEDFPLSDDLRQKIDLACLEFMEAHPNLECLAWPMHMFFSMRPPESALARRVEAVIANLGRTLVDLRVDAMYNSNGELQSESTSCLDPKQRERRRLFISRFCTQMTRLTSLKIEGGMPRDERREIIRAVHHCPLEKLVLLGVCCPVGNTWGESAIDLPEPLGIEEVDLLEGEHKDSTWHWSTKPFDPSQNPPYRGPAFGWPPQQPLLRTIADHFSPTITELKFCGYKGAPALFGKSPITDPLLASLQHFPRLRHLSLSFWLTTRFEGEGRDREIIDYWLASRTPSSTALVRVVAPDEELHGWERELRTKYAPDALARHVTRFLAPRLAADVTARGVQCRASFCIGDWGGIFDMDVWIGAGGACLGFEGPREELEEKRRRSKLVNRRWF